MTAQTSVPLADEHPHDPVPAPVREVMALFRGPEAPLEGVRFPDVDEAALAERADAVREQSAEMARLRGLLAAAREELERRQAELLGVAKTGLAYAQVFAKDDEALTERLQSLELAREGRKKSRRRSRKSKSKASTSKAKAAPKEPKQPEQNNTELPFSSKEPGEESPKLRAVAAG